MNIINNNNSKKKLVKKKSFSLSNLINLKENPQIKNRNNSFIRNFKNKLKNLNTQISTTISDLNNYNINNKSSLSIFQTVVPFKKIKKNYSHSNINTIKTIIKSNPFNFNKTDIKNKIKSIKPLFTKGTYEYNEKIKLSRNTEQLYYKYNILYGNKNNNLIKTYTPKLHQNSSSIALYCKHLSCNENNSPSVPVFNNEEIKLLFKAKYKDLGIKINEENINKFNQFCQLKCFNRKVDLSNCNLGLNSIKILLQIFLDFEKICVLNLAKNNLNDKGLILLSKAIKKSISLVSVDVSSNNITHEGGKQFINDLIEQQSIINIYLGTNKNRINSNHITEKGIDNIEVLLKQNKILEKINFSSNLLKNKGLEYIIKGLNGNYTLKYLSLSNNEITSEGMKILSNYIKTNRLYFLDLSYNNLGNDGIIKLTNALEHFNKLKELNLSYCNFEYKGLYNLILNFRYISNLKILNISGNKLSNENFIIIKSIFNLLNVTKLNMSFCQLNDKCGSIIGECLSHNKTIIKIDLSENGISDEGFKTFENLFRFNETIKKFIFKCNNISSETGKKFISNLKDNKSLIKLNLYGNQLENNIGNLVLKILDENKNLKQINLKCNKIDLRIIELIEEKIKNNNKNKNYLIPYLNKQIALNKINDEQVNYINKKIIEEKNTHDYLNNKIEQDIINYKNLRNKEDDELNNILNENNNIIKEISKLNVEIKNIVNETKEEKNNFQKLEKSIKNNINIVKHQNLKIKKINDEIERENNKQINELNEILDKTKKEVKKSKDDYDFELIQLNSKKNFLLKRKEFLNVLKNQNSFINNNNNNINNIKTNAVKRDSINRLKRNNVIFFKNTEFDFKNTKKIKIKNKKHKTIKKDINKKNIELYLNTSLTNSTTSFGYKTKESKRVITPKKHNYSNNNNIFNFEI